MAKTDSSHQAAPDARMQKIAARPNLAAAVATKTPTPSQNPVKQPENWHCPVGNPAGI